MHFKRTTRDSNEEVIERGDKGIMRNGMKVSGSRINYV